MASVGKPVSKDVKQQIRTSALAFLSFLNKSVTPFHAVESCESILKSAGLVELFENQRLKVQPRGKFYIKKNELLFLLLRLAEFKSLQVPLWWGGVWRSWFDRDLSIAGQVIFRGAQSEILHKLIDFWRPAIHLYSDRGKFEFNSEQQLRPILAQVSSDNSTNNKDEKKVDKDQLISGISITGDHHDIFLKSIGELAGCEPEELLDLDLYMSDTQPAVGSVSAQVRNKNLEEFLLLFNFTGCCLSFYGMAYATYCGPPDEPNAFECAIGRSYLISADRAHACHPIMQTNMRTHKPTFNKGVVVKINAN
ncbi:unnamed protein product [Meloidogyne enterolobii]|uniref:Uncharacterized protein n=1 Tax=Meloidogyne enterolobii TaxID=390850 RepID=A0ACB0ZE81_MELEN